MTQRTRVVGYVRVSTDRQAEHGVSLDAQTTKIREYAKLYDLSVVDVVRDAGASGKTLDRPGLNRVLDMLKYGDADAVVVTKLDRLTRRVVNLGELVEEYFVGGKWALLSVSEQIDTRTAGGRLVLNVLTSVAQWEREAIAERTSTALRHKAARGEFTGGEAPYGYRVSSDGKHLEQVRDEQRVLKQVAALRLTHSSLRAIARSLSAQGIRSRTGRPFAPVQISRMLRSSGALLDSGRT